MTITRRTLLLATAAAPFTPAFALAPSPTAGLQGIERDLNGRLGVAALDTGSGRLAGHRLDERFPMCSTFKAILAAQALARDAREPGFMGRRLHYAQADLVAWSPISGEHVGSGMTVAELCAATVQVSDNSAANLLMGELGGPAGLTAYARAIGDTVFRLDRRETELNSAIPGDERDTTTPRAMARTLRKLLVEDALPAPQRQQLRDWLLAATTGAKRIRAGVPANWRVGDKTGTGGYGTANDIGIAFPPDRPPIVIVVYTHQPAKDAGAREDIVAAATRAVLAAL